MKIVRRGAQPVGGDTGLDKIKALALAEPPAGSDRQRHRARRVRGLRRPRMQFIDPEAISPLNVVLDGANGMAGPMISPC